MVNTIKDLASDITIGAAGVTTLNIIPPDLNNNNVGTIIVTIFTCLMQVLKYIDTRNQQKKVGNKPTKQDN